MLFPRFAIAATVARTALRFGRRLHRCSDSKALSMGNDVNAAELPEAREFGGGCIAAATSKRQRWETMHGTVLAMRRK
jgi:hypothetical protein